MEDGFEEKTDTEHAEALKPLVRKAVTATAPESVKREEHRRIQKVRRKRQKPHA